MELSNSHAVAAHSPEGSKYPNAGHIVFHVRNHSSGVGVGAAFFPLGPSAP